MSASVRSKWVRSAAVSVALLLSNAGCGARTDLASPHQGGGGGGPVLSCPPVATCDNVDPICQDCVEENLATCGMITSCDASGECSGELPKVERCRIDAVETVECMLQCDLQFCEDTYFHDQRGPTMPLGLAFNDFNCSVCKPCANACAGTPNFSLVCGAFD